MIICSEWKCRLKPVTFCNLQNFYDHLKKFHGKKASETSKCPVCKRPFSNRQSFHRHFKLEHLQTNNNSHHVTETARLNLDHVPANTNVSETSVEMNESCMTSESLIEKSIDVRERDDASCEPPVIFSDQRLKEMLENTIFSFCSLLNSFTAVPSSHVTLTLNQVNDLIQEINFVYQQKMINLCQNLSESSSPQILESMNDVLKFVQSKFERLRSNFLQIQFLTKKGLFIKPESKFIGQTLKVKKRLNTMSRVPVNHTCVVIPLCKTLTLYLSQENVLSEIQDYLKKLEAEKVIIKNFVQGDLWKNVARNPDSITLPLLLFNDAFECGNPLGAHAGVNKINGTYFSIPCIPPEKRGSLDTIFLAQLTKSSVIKRFGYKSTFKFLIDELNLLTERGLNVQSPSLQEVKVYFQLGLLLGDNLGLNGIGGFIENFSKSNYSCRICLANKAQRDSMTVEDLSLLRTEANYKEGVRLKNPQATGIKEDSAFNKVTNFHVVSNAAVDIMHDLFEGLVKKVLVFLFQQYISEARLFTLSQLNARLASFYYGCDTSNKPSLLSQNVLKSGNMNISSAECICLFKYLSLILSGLVPSEDPVWELYVSLRRIVDILMSPALNRNHKQLLSAHIDEFLSLYLQLTHKPLTSKFHNLVHYPRLILKIGPLVNLWSMRYESKHKVFKSVANSINCRKNMCLSLAKKGMLQLSHKFHAKQFSEKEYSWGPVEPIKKSKIFLRKLKGFSVTTSLPHCLYDEQTLSVPWIEINGTKYCLGFTLFAAVDFESNLPLFGTLMKIFITDNQNVFFLLKNLETKSFNTSLYSYKVENVNSYSVLSSTSIQDFHPHNKVTLPCGSMFVTLLHTL